MGEDAVTTESVYRELAAVARQVDAAAVVFAGAVDAARVHQVAERTRLIVVVA